MFSEGLAILRTGLVTSVGMSAPATCAAIRAQVRSPSPSRFVDSDGQRIIAHQVPLDQPLGVAARLSRMLFLAVDEAIDGMDRAEVSQVPVLLCEAEQDRPHRHGHVEGGALNALSRALDVELSARSATIARGRTSVATAFVEARRLLRAGASRVLVAAADSFIDWPLLSHYEQRRRLLTKDNANGFMPGEGAGALLIASGQDGALICEGLGFGNEQAAFDSEEPNRAEGATSAIRMALADARCELDGVDYRISSVSGEHYYFREDSIAITRCLRRRKDVFDVWHPAECVGEVGALAGVICLAVAEAAARKGYAAGRRALVQLADDDGSRAAIIVRGEAVA